MPHFARTSDDPADSLRTALTPNVDKLPKSSVPIEKSEKYIYLSLKIGPFVHF